MRFRVTLTRNQEHSVTITAESVSYTDAPGFIMFKNKKGGDIEVFNASKVESVKTMPEVKQ